MMHRASEVVNIFITRNILKTKKLPHNTVQILTLSKDAYFTFTNTMPRYQNCNVYNIFLAIFHARGGHFEWHFGSHCYHEYNKTNSRVPNLRPRSCSFENIMSSSQDPVQRQACLFRILLQKKRKKKTQSNTCNYPQQQVQAI